MGKNKESNEKKNQKIYKYLIIIWMTLMESST